MRVIVFGGDGFCGWPTSLHLSATGHDVMIVDNLSRRNIDNELGINSLTPISSISTRLDTWESVTGKRITFKNLDISANYSELLNCLSDFQPNAIVHFAEQRAAPYSMKTSPHKCYTIQNNVNATHNILAAITQLKADIHLVHLGTMGVYGYGTAGMEIPEGYITAKFERPDGNLVDQQIRYPAKPGSVYHLSKVLDQEMFAYYNSNDDIAITDLHQGIVWGTQTDETKLNEKLVNRFDYDGDYGTVLNRFLMQAAVGHPITVHGTGGQTRAFIHIQDSVKCVSIALEHPPTTSEGVRIFNQMTETHRVIDLARLVSEKTEAKIDFVENPRNEASENALIVKNVGLLDLGLKPTTLQDGLTSEIFDIAKKYRQRCDLSKIPCTSLWKR